MMVETISNPSQGKVTTPSLTWLQTKRKERMDNDVVIPSRSLEQKRNSCNYSKGNCKPLFEAHDKAHHRGWKLMSCTSKKTKPS